MVDTRRRVPAAAIALIIAVGVGGWLLGIGAWITVTVAFAAAVVVAARSMRFPVALVLVTATAFSLFFLAGVADRLGLVPDGTGGQGVLVVLGLIPLVGAILVARVSSLRGEISQVTPWMTLIASGVAPAVFLLAAAVTRARYGINGVYWTLGGDARLHIDEFLLRHGPGAGPADALSPWSTFHGLMLALTARPDRASASVSALTVDAIEASWAATLLAAALTSVAASAVVVSVADRIGSRALIAIIVAGFLPLMGIGLGVSVLLGFTTALAVIPLVTLSLIAAMELTRAEQAPVLRILLLLAAFALAVLVLFGWSFAAAAPLAVAMFALLVAWRGLGRRGRVLIGALVIVSALGAGPAVLRFATTLRETSPLDWEGSMAPIAPALLAVTPLVTVAVIGDLRRRDLWLRMAPIIVGSVATAVLVTYMAYSYAAGPTWSYYASKTAWVWIAASLGVVALPLVRLASGFVSPENSRRDASTSAHRGRCLGAIAGLLAAGAVTLLVGQTLSPAASPVANVTLLPWSVNRPMLDGGYIPTPTATKDALFAGETGQPAVIWESGDPGNDRLANFILELYPWNKADDFRTWASQSDGSTAWLCELMARNPERVVYARSATIREALIVECGIPNPRVESLP